MSPDVSCRYRTWYYYDLWMAKATNTSRPSRALQGPQFVGGFAGAPSRTALKAMEVYYWPGVTRLSTTSGREEPNNRGVLVLVGLIGVFFAILLAVFALPHVRRARYDLFYLVHLPSAALFIFLGAVHDYSIQLFVVPGLVTYFLDRTNRLTWSDFVNFRKTSSYQRVLAHVRVMSEDLIGVDLVDTRSIATTEAAYGTQFLYLRVPALGSNSHPFSLAARCPSFVIKCNGDWTRRLHALAVTQATEALVASAESGRRLNPDIIAMDQLTKVTTKIVCEIDGVYGNASPPWRSYSHVIFVGGGVGVTPWLAAMEEHLELCRVQDPVEQSMQLVWIGRTFDDLQAMGPYLPRSNTTVYLTRLAKRSQSSLRPEDAPPAPSPVAKQLNQHAVRIETSKPWVTAIAVTASLFLTQLLYHYIRGDGSYYNTLVTPNISQSRYFWTKVAAVTASLAAIALSAIITRWASRSSLFASCPCFSGANAKDATAVHQLSSLSFSEQQIASASGLKIKLERPDMANLIEEAVIDIEASYSAPASPRTTGLFVCVCGPQPLTKSCADAVRVSLPLLGVCLCRAALWKMLQSAVTV